MTDDSRWSRLAALFDAAVTLPEEERGPWLAAACPDDAALRAEVVEMLEAHARAGILDRSPVPADTAPAVPPLHPAELSRRLEDALVERYIVERELGRGGAATVFLAHERKHARPVVLKVLNPEVAALFGHDRFAQEVQLAAKLSHPHILALIDSGDADGLLYYVMPYLDGETLRARLDRRGPLPLGEALTLLRDVADALAHAHRAGVVHRDLKPANVLVAGEHAFLLDFGIAKLVAPPTGAGDLTRHGLLMGTPAYMAPEQRTAASAADPRSDLYGWGLLAHEMLVGALPAAGDGGGARARLLAAGAPAALADLVAECLAADPAARPAGADALLARLGVLASMDAPRPRLPALRRLSPRASRLRARPALLALVAVALLLGGAAAWRRARASAEPVLTSPVAVAAFTNETGDPALDSWGRMAGDWLTQGLQQVGVAQVVPWPSALHASDLARRERADGRPVDLVARLHEETGAATVVTGSFYRVGDALEFRVDITDAARGVSLGAPGPVAAPVDSPHVAIRLLRDRVMSAARLLADDRLARTHAVELARRPPTFAAYQAFDRGLARFLDQGYAEAGPEFLRAHALDTTFLVPLLYAASTSWNRGEYAAAESLLAVVAARRGELTRYDALVAEAMSAQLAGDGQRALAALREAAELAPQARAAYSHAVMAIETDHLDEALERLRAIDPDRGELRGWSSYWTQLAHALHLTGRHEEELAAARELRRRFPTRRVGAVLEARALAALGRAAAVDSLIAAERGQSPTTYWSQGAAMVVAGEELRAHGHRGAEAWLRRGASWLEQQLALTEGHEGHRENLAAAYYDLGRWADAARLYDRLVVELPSRFDLRGRGALAAARAGLPGADERLGPVPPHHRGEHVAFQARLAMVRGHTARATALFADAVRDGVDGLPWLHAMGWHELAPLAKARAAVPQALRVVP